MKKDLTNIYKIDEQNGIVKYTVKTHGKYYTGKAKANTDEGDVFDVEKGKRIAKLRALLKMKRALLREALEFQHCINQLKTMEDELTDRIQRLTQSAFNISDKLNKELGIEPVETPV